MYLVTKGFLSKLGYTGPEFPIRDDPSLGKDKIKEVLSILVRKKSY